MDFGVKRSEVKVKLTYSATLCCYWCMTTQTVLSLEHIDRLDTSYTDGRQRKKDTYTFWGYKVKGQGHTDMFSLYLPVDVTR